MAQLAFAGGVPHTPAFPALIAGKVGPWEEIRECYAEVAEPLAAARLDALVIVSSDHFNTFFLDNWPQLAIAVTDRCSGPNDETPALPVRELAVAEGLAAGIFETATSTGFDLSRVGELTLDHTFVVPIELLEVGDTPIVPLFVNTFVEPTISATRARRLGETLRRAIEAHPEPLRVGVLASGSFSLEVGGPRIADGQMWGVPDPAWSARVTELIATGDLDTLVAEATPERLRAAGNAGAELLDWIAALACAGPDRATTIRQQAAFGHAYATFVPAGDAS